MIWVFKKSCGCFSCCCCHTKPRLSLALFICTGRCY
uniref:Uncharacterized protein n=1 Tax=Anguilla anguilla TaxID=7936 RepID=A0A0E9V9Y7_ANGAN